MTLVIIDLESDNKIDRSFLNESLPIITAVSQTGKDQRYLLAFPNPIVQQAGLPKGGPRDLVFYANTAADLTAMYSKSAPERLDISIGYSGRRDTVMSFLEQVNANIPRDPGELRLTRFDSWNHHAATREERLLYKITATTARVIKRKFKITNDFQVGEESAAAYLAQRFQDMSRELAEAAAAQS